jgi:hypothetical protein
LQNFVVPETNHTKSPARQVPRAFEIVQQEFGVLSSVDFNDQSRTQAHEVRNVTADRHLPPEPVTAHPSIA